MSYGSDTWCYDQIFTGRMATGIEVLAQACYRRITTPTGTVDDGEEGATYGFDVLGFIGRVGTQNAVDVLPVAVEAELLKDDRIERVEASATAVTGSDGLTAITLDIDVFPNDESGAFQLSISVSDLDVSHLGTNPL